MSLGHRLGHWDYLRVKGEPLVEMVRRWLLVAMGASATGKFVFQLSTEWSVGLLVAVPLVGEGLATGLGWLMARYGVVQSHYQTALDLDPYRSESLRLLAAIERHLANLPPRSTAKEEEE